MTIAILVHEIEYTCYCQVYEKSFR